MGQDSNPGLLLSWLDLTTKLPTNLVELSACLLTDGSRTFYQGLLYVQIVYILPILILRGLKMGEPSSQKVFWPAESSRVLKGRNVTTDNIGGGN